MRAMMLLLVAAGLTGCGVGESTFAAEFTLAYCDYLLECEDPAILTFDGIETMEDCEAYVAPTVVTLGTGCDYSRGPGKKCIDAMALMTCPSEGFEFVPPAECIEVYEGCGIDLESDSDTETDTDSDTGSDTDTES